MKKILFATVIIFSLFFSADKAFAGPAYEILKTKDKCLVKVMKIGTLTEEELRHLIPQILTFMEQMGFSKIRVQIQSKQAEMVITKFEHIYSDLSFKEMASSHSTIGLFGYHLCKYSKRLREKDFRYFKGIVCEDLASKNMTRMHIFNIFKLMDFFRQFVNRN